MGTITIPDPLPSSTEDCEKLRKAFQGWGTDEKAIIKILGHRDASQRSDISMTYSCLYNESLVHRLQSELSGDFGRAVILWATDPAERDARLVNEALKAKGNCNLYVIVEIACASTPDHLIAVRKAYCALFSSSLEEDIASYFPQQRPMGQLLVRLVSSYRYNGDRVDELLAKSEAAKLYNAIRMKQPDYEEVIRVLGTRNKSQLKAAVEHYKQDYQTTIDEDIDAINDNDKFASTLKAAVWCLISPEKHFAEVVRRSILGLGTDEESLTRAIVSRAEIDMKKIKEEYKSRYQSSLSDDVIGDTCGYYKDFLLTLVGSVIPWHSS